VAYLKTGEIRGAVNAGGIKLDLPADEAAFCDLAVRIGAMLARYSKGGYKTVTLRVSGAKAPKLTNTMMRLAVVELLKPYLTESVNVINVATLAKTRGLELVSIHEPQPPQGLVGDVIGIRVENEDGESHRILGTVYLDGLPRILRIDKFAMDMIPAGDMILLENNDRPGVIGAVGSTLGAAGVNIADMVISRTFEPGGTARALMVIKTDSETAEVTLDELRRRPNVTRISSLVLPPIGK
jgi:hypothetical protein